MDKLIHINCVQLDSNFTDTINNYILEQISGLHFSKFDIHKSQIIFSI